MEVTAILVKLKHLEAVQVIHTNASVKEITLGSMSCSFILRKWSAEYDCDSMAACIIPTCIRLVKMKFDWVS